MKDSAAPVARELCVGRTTRDGDAQVRKTEEAGYYGKAAPAVAEYDRLLVDQCVNYTDFSKRRDWIYPIHDEQLYRHGFVEKARAILDRAAELAENDTIRERALHLKLGVVYVESVQLYTQMRNAEQPPESARYDAVVDEFRNLCQQLGIELIKFYDGSRKIERADEWVAELQKVRERRFDQRVLHDVSHRAFCDGSVLDEDFNTVATGDIPSIWKRRVQSQGQQEFGIAEVSRQFAKGPTLHLRDERSHVVVWSAWDEVLPAGSQWAVQFDFRLSGGLVYKASDTGEYKAAQADALFGLKRGAPGKQADFLPLIQVNNDEKAGEPVQLLAMGKVVEDDVTPDTWHRIVIHRDGATWQFYLDEQRVDTLAGIDTDLRGYAFGSFRHWTHIAQDVHYANFKIGNFTQSRE